jgi:predicted S18 family serine protease
LLKTRSAIKQVDEEVDAKELRTITDLETYIIVKERLRDAEKSLRFDQPGNVTANQVGYAMERLHSARVWSSFFNMPGREYAFDDEYLAEACAAKISEAEERINYVRLYYPLLLENAQSVLQEAYANAEEEAHALCLFQASKAVAEANIIASVLGVETSVISDVVEEKLAVVERHLLRQQERELFPILGYSYWEYAQALAPYDEFSALTFAEYALELGNLALYFPRKQSSYPVIDLEVLSIYLSGLFTGIAISLFVAWRIRQRAYRKGPRTTGRKPRRPQRGRGLPGKKR